MKYRNYLYYFDIFAYFLILLNFFVIGVFENLDFSVSIGAVSLYLSDILIVLILFFIVIKLFLKKITNYQKITLVILFFVMMIISLLLGVYKFGLEQSGNSSRSYFYFFTVVLFSSISTPQKKLIKGIFTLWAWFALVLILIAIYRWIFISTSSNYISIWASASGDPFRVLNAGVTFFLLQGFIIYWYAKKLHLKLLFPKIIPALLIIGVIILQHRTVWVVMVTIILLMVFLDGHLNKKIFIISIFVFIIGLAIVFIFGEQIINSLSTSASNLQNFYWRLEGWKFLISPQNMGSFINYILGHAFGTGYAREILGSTITASPHNYYIQLLHDFGFLGLSIFGLLYFGLSIRFFKFHKVEPANRIMLVLLSSQLIFNLAYSPNLEQGIILGLALAINRIPKDLEKFNIWVEDDNFLKDEMKVTL